MNAISALEELLLKEFQKFELDFDGKKVWTPYRINIPFQSDRRRYGKSSAVKIKLDTEEIAKEVGFDLKSVSPQEIGDFMRQQMLGIDCSGFVYQIFDEVLLTLGIGTMEKIGFPKASATNVRLLTDKKFAEKIEDTPQNIRSGDMIRFGPDQEGQWHVLLVIKNSGSKITYVHSSTYNLPDGISTGEIKIHEHTKTLVDQEWNEKLSNGQNRQRLYASNQDNGVYRLNVLK